MPRQLITILETAAFQSISYLQAHLSTFQVAITAFPEPQWLKQKDLSSLEFLKLNVECLTLEFNCWYYVNVEACKNEVVEQ